MSQDPVESSPKKTNETSTSDAKSKPKRNRTGTTIELSTMALQVLKDAGDASPFPGAGAIASLALQILAAVQNARDNKDALKLLAYDAIAVATTIVEQFNGIKEKEQTVPSLLEKHAKDLESTMKEILDFTESQNQRNRLYRIISSKSDTTTIQGYRQRLQQAMDLFGVQSNIDIRSALDRVEHLLLKQTISDGSAVESPTVASPLHTDAPNTPTLPSSGTPDTSETTSTSDEAPNVKPSESLSLSEFPVSDSPAPRDTPSASETPVLSEPSMSRATHNPFVHRNSGVSPQQPPTSPVSLSPTMFSNSSVSTISGNVTFNAVSGNQSVTTNNVNNQSANTGNIYHTYRTMTFPAYGPIPGYNPESPRRHSTMPHTEWDAVYEWKSNMPSPRSRG